MEEEGTEGKEGGGGALRATRSKERIMMREKEKFIASSINVRIQ